MLFIFVGALTLIAIIFDLYYDSLPVYPTGWRHFCATCGNKLSDDERSYVHPLTPPKSIVDGDIHTYECSCCASISLYIGGTLSVHEEAILGG